MITCEQAGCILLQSQAGSRSTIPILQIQAVLGGPVCPSDPAPPVGIPASRLTFPAPLGSLLFKRLQSSSPVLLPPPPSHVIAWLSAIRACLPSTVILEVLPACTYSIQPSLPPSIHPAPSSTIKGAHHPLCAFLPHYSS